MCNVVVLSLTLFAVAFPDGVHGMDCGVQNIISEGITRITGGNLTRYGEFPWIAALRYTHSTTGRNAGVNCAGFVIKKNFVVTTATCLTLQNLNLADVWLGVRQISTTETMDADKVRIFEIEKLIPHKDYSSVSKIHDIALVKLKSEIYYTDYIRPICLPEPELGSPLSRTMVTVSGWGAIRSGAEVSDYKLAVEIPIYSNADCARYLQHHVRADQLCGEGEFQRGTCWGDAGGPLMLILPAGIEKHWYAVGIVSFSNGCGEHGKPVIHTRLSSYVQWIEKSIYLSSLT